MTKRRKLTKEQREFVYNKFRGHCAYCGCKIDIKDMQVDHVAALERGGTDELDNMFPACRSCNHYKHTLTVEKFRSVLEHMPDVLMRDNVTYKNAVRFGLVIPNPQKITFYFETDIREGGDNND